MYIRKLADSLCRDGVDLPRPPHIHAKTIYKKALRGRSGSMQQSSLTPPL